MPKFIYEAKQGPKDLIRGTLVAENQRAAIDELSRQGYFIISVEEAGKESAKLVTATSPKPGLGARASLFGRVSLKETTHFTRQLGDLLESGIPIVKALDILSNQTTNKKLKSVITDIRDNCIGGTTLSGAVAKHPDVFKNLFVVMIRAGETAGSLEAVLKRLTDFNEKELQIGDKVRAALAYPMLMSAVGVLTIFALLAFVVPNMVSVFQDMGQALPLPTLILIGMSQMVTRFWWATAGTLIVVGWALVNFYHTEQGRILADRLKLKIPVFGSLIQKVEIARFAHTLSTLLENGVAVLESLRVAADTVENILIKKEIDSAYTAVKAGLSLSVSLRESKAIPVAVIQMIAVGEESGRLEKTLFKVAEVYDRETDSAIRLMLSLLEPILILTLGLVVGFIVISILLPIIEIGLLTK